MLCIDPSSSAPGFAYFINEKPVQCETVVIKGKDFFGRMKIALIDLKDRLDTFLPDYIAIETPYLGISKATSMKMGQIYGMFCAEWLMNNGDPQNIIEIHPMTAKMAAGASHFKNREEGKKTVFDTINERYPYLTPVDDNSTDAVAVGLAALIAIKEKYE